MTGGRHDGSVATWRGKTRLVSVAAVLAGFAVPATGVYVWLKVLWPTQHDLSDIGTGLMRLMFAFLAGVVGAVIAWRYRHHRPRASR